MTITIKPDFYWDALKIVHPETASLEKPAGQPYTVWDTDKNVINVDELKVDIELDRLNAEYDAQAYARKRQLEYPSIQECVHAILDDQLDALQAKRAEIKTKYPKG